MAARFCGKCGSEIKEGAKFCNKCGWQVPIKIEKQSVDEKKLVYEKHKSKDEIFNSESIMEQPDSDIVNNQPIIHGKEKYIPEAENTIEKNIPQQGTDYTYDDTPSLYKEKENKKDFITGHWITIGISSLVIVIMTVLIVMELF